MPLNAREIRNTLLLDPIGRRTFHGVYSRDNMPVTLPVGRDCSLIVNTDAKNGQGLHWIVLYITKNRDNCVYFDSFGRGPSAIREFSKFVHRHVRRGTYNARQLQDVRSTACGLYCVYVIHELSGGKHIMDVLGRFGTNTRQNDELVTRWYRRTYPGQRLRPERGAIQMLRDYDVETIRRDYEEPWGRRGRRRRTIINYV
jgi:hypothetical protein